jgi:predicted PurR-regulated permease PerM
MTSSTLAGRAPARLAFALVLAAVIAYVLHEVTFVLLVILTGVLLAILFDGIASSVANRTFLPRTVALVVTIVVMLGSAVVFVLFTGPQLADQLETLGERIPQGLRRLEAEVSQQAWGRSLLNGENGEEGHQGVMPPVSTLVGGITDAFGVAFGVLANMMAILVLAVFLSVQPDRYRRGALALFTRGAPRKRAREVLERLGEALRWWLVARALSMTAVGILTLIGLLIIGLDMALALAVIAALLSIIPFIGPVVAAVPAILVGILDGPSTALWVAAVYGAVQLVESNLITPVIENRALDIPPGALIASQMIMAVLFGLFGVLLATPLLVITITLVEALGSEDEDDQRTGTSEAA